VPASVHTLRERTLQGDPALAQVAQALRGFHLLLRTHRLYHPEHPRVLDSLDQAYDGLRIPPTN